MNLDRIKELARQHEADAAYYPLSEGRTITKEEHEEIAHVFRLYLASLEHNDRRELAKAAMQGLLTGMASDPMNLISGPQIAVTAVDIADCLESVLTRGRRKV